MKRTTEKSLRFYENEALLNYARDLARYHISRWAGAGASDALKKNLRPMTTAGCKALWQVLVDRIRTQAMLWETKKSWGKPQLEIMHVYHPAAGEAQVETEKSAELLAEMDEWFAARLETQLQLSSASARLQRTDLEPIVNRMEQVAHAWTDQYLARYYVAFAQGYEKGGRRTEDCRFIVMKDGKNVGLVRKRRSEVFWGVPERREGADSDSDSDDDDDDDDDDGDSDGDGDGGEDGDDDDLGMCYEGEEDDLEEQRDGAYDPSDAEDSD
jgi:hypothetical protein